MKQFITHVTHYRYTAPVTYSIQTLRLTPRDDEHQRVLRWHIEAPGALEKQVDAYGNITHTLTLNHPHTDIELRVVGQVQVAPLARGLLGFYVSETAICETLWRNALSAFGMDRIAASLA
ncbi:hypothetical protein G6F65_016285 [Rhizopus arrhizus]|nr:hypothetical protein G6F65_016285 [Rhizopus arrhizus]